MPAKLQGKGLIPGIGSSESEARVRNELSGGGDPTLQVMFQSDPAGVMGRSN